MPRYNDVLKLLRKSEGYGLKELAKKLEVSISYISKIETGTKSPNIELIEKYAKTFNLNPSIIHSLAYNLNKDDDIKTNFRKILFKFMKKIEKWSSMEKDFYL
ncbi:MAG: helix-turn-helix transcriptional regulator [Clostridiales bacterium]